LRKIPLWGSGTVGKSAVVTAGRRLNCYYEIRPDADKNKIAIYGTPGTTLFTSLGNSTVRGWWVAGNGVWYAVAGATLYSISTLGVATSLGTLSTNSGYVSMTDNGTQLIIVDGTAGYIWNYNTNTFSTISSGGFPNGATSVGFLTGFFMVEKPNTGQYYISNSYDGTTWPSTFATAESNPDALVAISVDHGLMILWGSNSIEFWQNVGTIGNPFAPLQGASQQWGLAAKFSRAVFSNSIAFLAQNLQGQIQVMTLQGFTPTRISDHDVENIINGFSVVADAIAFSYMLDGHSMYQITFPTAGRSFLYDGSTNIWSEVQTGLSPVARHIANLGITYNGDNYVSDYSNGNIYLLDPTNYTDNGTAIKRLIQTRHINESGNVLSIDEVFLDMETGVGLQLGQGSNPQVVMQVSKDGGRTWGAERWTSFGMVGQYVGPRATWRRCGSARDFVFRFWITDPVKFALTYGSAITRSEGK
jgi:hypothetical protein